MLSSSSSTRRFSLEEIEAATNQFDPSNLLGKGGEAIVYSAEIYIDSKKTRVAVKHLNDLKNKRDNTKEFESEIQILSKIQHPNIVSLIGYCNESGQKILVYEYMAKGCLSDYLKKKKDKPLSWLKRLNICLDVARGLQHLHIATEEFSKGTIHRDVKPGNILVDENWVGKLSDFGMFKLSNVGQDESTMITDRKGTSGFFAPEYNNLGLVTRKIDVFSFGVVLFQVLCEKMPWDREDESYYFDENEDLGIWALENVDAQIRREMSGKSLTLFTDIIGRSLQAKPGKRPTMNDVVLDLQKVLLECQETENQPKQLKGSPRMEEELQSMLGRSRAVEAESSDSIDRFLKMVENQPRRFSPQEIESLITRGFKTKLGSGGFGVVYKGVLENGVLAAVKKLKDDKSVKKMQQQFMAEVRSIGNTHHINLVRLQGYCIDPTMAALVYEYMEKGSLDKFLFDENYKVIIEWRKLHEIAIGTAKGIAYLHEECQPRIIHYDIKPENILLDENFTPKVADFGLAKMCGIDARRRRTRGYVAPEMGTMTYKCDVYSFGIVLFEIVGRRRHVDTMSSRAWEMFRKNEWLDLVLVWGIEERDKEKAKRMVMVALLCIQHLPERRPVMSDVVKMLEGEMEIPTPHLSFEPTFWEMEIPTPHLSFEHPYLF